MNFGLTRKEFIRIKIFGSSAAAAAAAAADGGRTREMTDVVPETVHNIGAYWHPRNRIIDNNKCLPFTAPFARPSISRWKAPSPRFANPILVGLKFGNLPNFLSYDTHIQVYHAYRLPRINRNDPFFYSLTPRWTMIISDNQSFSSPHTYTRARARAHAHSQNSVTQLR